MIKILLKLACFGLAFVVLLELIARAEDSIRFDAPFWGHYHLEGIRATDDRGTSRCAANARYKHFELGEHGFRLTPRITEADRTLVWLGASEAFGLYESPGQDIANQLEQTLADKGASINVVNASCFGLNLTRLTRLVEDPVQSLKPDMLVLYPTPHFYLDLIEVAADKPKAQQQDQAQPFVSRLAFKSRDVLKSFLPTKLQDWIREYQGSRALGSAGDQDLWNAPPEDRLALFEAHLRELIGTAKATGARVAVATHANAFHKQAEVNASLLQAWQKFYPRANDTVLIEFDAAANGLVRRLAQEYAVEVVDIAERVAGDPNDFADFSHFTDSGAAKVAAELEAWATLSGGG